MPDNTRSRHSRTSGAKSKPPSKSERTRARRQTKAATSGENAAAVPAGQETKSEGHGFSFFWKKYGLTFVVTYLAIEWGLLFILFLAVSNGLMNTSNMESLLAQIGHEEAVPVSLNDQIIAVASHMPNFALWPFGGIEGLTTWEQGFLATNFGISFHMVGSFIVAYIANKCCEPPRLAITLAATPVVASWLASKR
jgi:hypothetical protein